MKDLQLSIYVNDNEIILPAHLYTAGRAQMVCQIAQLSESVNVQELNDINQLKQSAARQISLPYCEINNLIFSQKIKFSVILYTGSSQRQNYDTLRLVQRNDKTQSYEVELSQSKNWAESAKTLKLSELDLTEYTLTENSLVDCWDNPFDLPFYFPLFFYGKTLVPNTFSVEDFRPQFFVKSILQAIFDKLGITLKCEYLETEHGKRLLTYILDAEWYKYSNKGVGSDYNVRLTRLPPFLPQTRVLTASAYNYLDWTNRVGQFASTVVAEGMAYNGKFDTTYFGSAKFSITIPIASNPSGTSGYIGIAIIETSPTSVQKVIKLETKNFTLGTQNLTIDLEVESDFEVLIGYKYNVMMTTGVPILTVTAFGETNFFCTAKHILSGDIVKMSELINQKMTALNFIKGFLHLINGKIVQNGGEIEIFSSYDTVLKGEGIRGLYNQANTFSVPITDVVINSMVVQYVENEKQEYTVQFKTSTDANIKALPENEQNLFAHIGVGENVKELTNPIFEPTKDFELNPSYANATDAPIIPFLLDNTDLKISHKIAPRVFLLQGYVDQLNKDASNIRNWKFESTYRAIVPYASQFPDANIFDERYYLTFGEHPQSHYVVFYEKDIRKNLSKNIIQIDVKIPYNFVENYLYHVISIFYHNRTLNYIIDSIDNYVHGSEYITLNLKRLNDD